MYKDEYGFVWYDKYHMKSKKGTKDKANKNYILSMKGVKNEKRTYIL